MASSPVNRVKGMPPIGKADHDIVYVEYDIKAKRIQQAPRKIYLYKRADVDGLRDHSARYKDSFLSSDHSHMSVNIYLFIRHTPSTEYYVPGSRDMQ